MYYMFSTFHALTNNLIIWNGFLIFVLLCIYVYFQGIPFFHAGDEILRSKSLDRDSYNSGDWFNKYCSGLWILTQTLITS
jgi:hypothetical protein